MQLRLWSADFFVNLPDKTDKKQTSPMIENNNTPGPVAASRRIVILDALRGFALMGIALANFPEFALWTFLSDSQQGSMPTAAADNIVRYVQYMLVDGKFYTIFSVLFGIGFSIIISHAMERGGNGLRIFYRRMAVLLAIGLLHLMFVWSGDILTLYALMGLLLPLFRRQSGRSLLAWALALLSLPILWEVLVAVISYLNSTCVFPIPWSGKVESPSNWLYDMWWKVADMQGITDANFATWLRDATSYADVFRFLIQGAVERMWEFVSGQRYFKVSGLFLIGYYIGKQMLFQRLTHQVGQPLKNDRRLLSGVCRWGLSVGLPLSALYAYESVNGHPWGPLVHETLYAASVYPLAFAYMAGICLIYLRRQSWHGWQVMAYPGRMALTCYIGQSFAGILLFYGIGLGLGANIGLWPTELVSLTVFAIEILLSGLWLRFFNFGPLEWLWRMLTYVKRFKLKREDT